MAYASQNHKAPATPLPDLAALLSSWELELRSEHKCTSRIEQHTIGGRLLLRWCHANRQTRPWTGRWCKGSRKSWPAPALHVDVSAALAADPSRGDR